MPPKTKKRKGAKESEEELLINERLTEVIFKYRQDESEEEVEDEAEEVSMFEDENPKIKLKDIEKVVKEVDIVEWDPAVMALIEEEERETGRVNMEKIKIILMTLKVNNMPSLLYVNGANMIF